MKLQPYQMAFVAALLGVHGPVEMRVRRAPDAPKAPGKQSSNRKTALLEAAKRRQARWAK